MLPPRLWGWGFKSLNNQASSRNQNLFTIYFINRSKQKTYYHYSDSQRKMLSYKINLHTAGLTRAGDTGVLTPSTRGTRRREGKPHSGSAQGASSSSRTSILLAQPCTLNLNLMQTHGCWRMPREALKLSLGPSPGYTPAYARPKSRATVSSRMVFKQLSFCKAFYSPGI